MIWWIVLLSMGGVALVLAEMLLPGGVLGAIGIVMLMGCVGIGFYYYPDYAIFIMIGEILLLFAAVGFELYIVAYTEMGDRLRLNFEQSADKGWVNEASDEALVGKIGTVMTPLRPAGTVIIEDERIDAVSNGTYIEKDEEVEVIEVHGNRVVVERAATGEGVEESAAT